MTLVLLLDMRALGGLPSLADPRVKRVLGHVALGLFVLAVATGLALFSVRASDYAANPVFLVKLALIGSAALNFVLIARRGANLRRVAALASLVLWPAALIAGRFIGFVE